MYSPDKKRIWKKRETLVQGVSDTARADAVSAISSALGISRAGAGLIYDRGMTTPAEAIEFTDVRPDGGHDPFLLTDMEKACARIEEAAEAGDTVAVFGDYDVDGVTSCTMLYLYLVSRGLRTGYYIPKRSDGYGVSKSAIDLLAANGVTLIVTVDTGVTACDETEYASSLGIDVVVTDHHESLNRLPDAVAVVDPHRPGDLYPFRDLAGVGVAFKLVSALEKRRAAAAGEDPDEAVRRALREYGDLLAVGTVADVMPLTGENRTFVSYGLGLLAGSSPRTGFLSLMEKSGRAPKGRISASYISFTLGPRINAAGRMDNASLAVELLLAETRAEADRIADILADANLQRQREENRIASEAAEMIESDPSFRDDAILLLGSDGWAQGVIGIVASRITEKYDKPAILVSFDPDGDASDRDVGKGSGRSIPGISLFDALAFSSDLLVKFGGHEQAAGLTVRRGMLPELRRRLNEYVSSRGGSRSVPVLEYDGEPDPCDLTVSFYDEITGLLEPCGSGNPSPVFMLSDAVISGARPISAGKHTKLSVTACGRSFDALLYGTKISELPYAEGDVVDLLYSLDKSEYQGRVSVQMIVSDIRCASSVYRERMRDISRLAELSGGGDPILCAADIPEREDFVALYGIIDRIVSEGRTSFTDREMMRRLSSSGLGGRIGFVKYKIMLRVFAETGVFRLDEEPAVPAEGSSEWRMPVDVVGVRVPERRGKADLEASALMRRLRSLVPD
ncbi:MAG: single-stranded-DNA-specific exonuclease RecJ [Clostridia bacterium]|nr:single-stranded-DNA-specific exonuclease RecJ [Clostridia bacterium]